MAVRIDQSRHDQPAPAVDLAQAGVCGAELRHGPSSEVTSAIRLPATPTAPVNVRAPSPHMGSSVAFEKSVAIGHFLIFVRPPRVFTFTGSSSIELPCTVTTSRPSTEFE